MSAVPCGWSVTYLSVTTNKVLGLTFHRIIDPFGCQNFLQRGDAQTRSILATRHRASSPSGRFWVRRTPRACKRERIFECRDNKAIALNEDKSRSEQSDLSMYLSGPQCHRYKMGCQPGILPFLTGFVIPPELVETRLPENRDCYPPAVI